MLIVFPYPTFSFCRLYILSISAMRSCLRPHSVTRERYISLVCFILLDITVSTCYGIKKTTTRILCSILTFHVRLTFVEITLWDWFGGRILTHLSSIAQVRYIKILTTQRFWGQNCKFYTTLCIVLQYPEETWAQRIKTKPKKGKKWPEGIGVIGVILEFQYIERGLFSPL